MSHLSNDIYNLIIKQNYEKKIIKHIPFQIENSLNFTIKILFTLLNSVLFFFSFFFFNIIYTTNKRIPYLSFIILHTKISSQKI